MDPIILSSFESRHGADLDKTISRLESDAQYRDLSTIIIKPTYKAIPAKVVASWENLIMPPNQKIARLYTLGMEVGEAYSRTIEAIVGHPELTKWKYILTIEHDNMPPADGFLRLLSRMESEECKEYAAIGGLYFTKGEGGCAQIWGDPYSFPLNFRPQKPDPNGGLKECCGTGMGFTLFRLDTFKNKKLRKPWFKTSATKEEGIASQDLYFWSDARKSAGLRCTIDCSVKVGHLDSDTDVVW